MAAKVNYHQKNELEFSFKCLVLRLKCHEAKKMLNIPVKVGYMDKFPDFGAKGFNVDHYNERFHQANFIINARAKHISFPKHWGTLSIKSCLAGTEFYEASDMLYGVDCDNYLIFNQGLFYSSWIDSAIDVESFTVTFSPVYIQDYLSSCLKSAGRNLDDPQSSNFAPDQFVITERLHRHDNSISPVLTKIHLLSQQTENHQEELGILFYKLLERISQKEASLSFEIESIQKVRHGTKAELFRRLNRAKDFIYSAYFRDLSLTEIADVACLNRYYFLRQFKSAFQLTPHQYLTQRRMQVADQLLRGSSKSVSDVCSAVGFNDLSSFSKLYKSFHGISPRQVR